MLTGNELCDLQNDRTTNINMT